ncbi:MAG: c-type cytochrome [Chitinophagaceae bacterium]|nr:c-type cytochrome [Chitinophagaceae bacterium]
MKHIQKAILDIDGSGMLHKQILIPLFLMAIICLPFSCRHPETTTTLSPTPETSKLPDPLPPQNIMSVAPAETDNSVEAELASFKVAPGYTIELYASESLGIAKPVAMRWDERGRLWVLCTTTYPHREIGKAPDDKLFILEDTDNDGKADSSSVFADSLNIPLGFELGHGGVYLGQQTELLFLEDMDDDGKADKRSVLFSGFGTGDLHQTINSFTWSPGGDLFFSQGHNIYSRIETPWGIKRQNRAGIWRYQPATGKLDNFFDWSTASVNPWGINFDDWGNMFHKANDPPLYYSVPGLIENSKRSYLPEIGQLEIKGSGLVIVRSEQMPKGLQGDFVMAGYYNNRVERMKITDDASGFKARLIEPLVISGSRSFRPVEVSMGPDGSIYVLDWYNPIIGHYQASLRHPDRDKSHGRIWRITAKGRPLVQKPALTGQPVVTLLDHLSSPEFWTRYQVKRLLAAASKNEVVPAVNAWLQKLAPQNASYEHNLVDAAGVLESHDTVNEKLLTMLMQGKQAGARGYAAHLLSKWHDRIADPLHTLRVLINDHHPRVRLQALVASSYIRDVQSIVVAADIFNHPTDKFIRYAWENTVYALRPVWEKAMQEGKLNFSRPAHVAHVISDNPPAWFPASDLMALIALKDVLPTEKTELLLALAQAENGMYTDTVLKKGTAFKDAVLLDKISALPPHPVSNETIDYVTAALKSDSEAPFRLAVINFLREWKIKRSVIVVKQIAGDESQDVGVRSAAIQALANVEGANALPLLEAQVRAENAPLKIKIAALKSLGELDINKAVSLAITEIQRSAGSVGEVQEIMSSVLERNGSIALISDQLKSQPVPAKTANYLLEALARKGIEAPDLRKQLNAIAGHTSTVPAVYDSDYIQQLLLLVKNNGDAARGEKVYGRLPACASCHTINGKGGTIGPNLSALGRGLSAEEIAIEVVWPSQNIKEGYNRVTAETNNGEMIQGVKLSEDRETIRIRTATGESANIQKKSLKHIEESGSLMPGGLVDGIEKEELADLIKYLSMLGQE